MTRDLPPLAVTLLSGGPDSVVASALALEDGYRLAALFVDYGQRSAEREESAAFEASTWLGCEELRVARLPFLKDIGGSAMLQGSPNRVTQANRDSEYVPFRNTILLSLAVAWAETLGAHAIVIGAIGGPWITPDNCPEYFDAVREVIRLGSRLHAEGLRLLVPLGSFSKAEMLTEGLRLEVPFEMTWSCQNANDIPCGECNNCLDRARAFDAIIGVDPLVRSNGD